MSKHDSTPEHADWEHEEEFDYTADLTLPEWGWEFLRRNPDYRKSWETARGDFAISSRKTQITLIEVRNQEKALGEWGCLYSSDPRFDARSSTVLWRPDLCSRVLRFSALPSSDDTDADRFCLSDIACSSVLLRGFVPTQHLFFRDGNRGLQLAAVGANLLAPVRLLPGGLVGSACARQQLRLQRCFTDFRIASRLLPSHFPRENMSARLKRVLRALDGSMAGASHRQIAEMLFGEERVETDWCAAGRPLRDKVRRTIHRGYTLMQGGYRSLLR